MENVSGFGRFGHLLISVEKGKFVCEWAAVRCPAQTLQRMEAAPGHAAVPLLRRCPHVTMHLPVHAPPPLVQSSLDGKGRIGF